MSYSHDILFQALYKTGEISPFLFLSENLELLHAELSTLLGEIIQEFSLDALSVFRILDNEESIKIEEIKLFLRSAEVRPRFAFQIFYIEHLSRMTVQAQNACLKFFEEPGKGNIVILTNPSEAGILETILSRVQKIQTLAPRDARSNPFFHSLLSSHREKKSDELLRYFFQAKLEKAEYVDFLQTLLITILESGTQKERGLLWDLEEDIQGILQNNLQGRYIVDKYILKL